VSWSGVNRQARAVQLGELALVLLVLLAPLALLVPGAAAGTG
jgi:hypothetical protein